MWAQNIHFIFMFNICVATQCCWEGRRHLFTWEVMAVLWLIPPGVFLHIICQLNIIHITGNVRNFASLLVWGDSTQAQIYQDSCVPVYSLVLEGIQVFWEPNFILLTWCHSFWGCLEKQFKQMKLWDWQLPVYEAQGLTITSVFPLSFLPLRPAC